jgi:hypothetical protein
MSLLFLPFPRRPKISRGERAAAPEGNRKRNAGGKNKLKAGGHRSKTLLRFVSFLFICCFACLVMIFFQLI